MAIMGCKEEASIMVHPAGIIIRARYLVDEHDSFLELQQMNGVQFGHQGAISLHDIMPSSSSIICWSPPQPNWIKLNFDGS